MNTKEQQFKVLTMVFGLALLMGCAQEKTNPIQAELLAPEIVSSAAPEFATTVSADGKELFFTRSSEDRSIMWIMRSALENGPWSMPESVNFSTGEFRDVDPFLSKDGQRLYFSSIRPRFEGDTLMDFDTWYVDRTPTGWSEPVNAGAPLNAKGSDIFITIADNGNAYFVSERFEKRGIVSIPINATEQTAELLDLRLNGEPYYSSNPCIASDDSFMITAVRPPGREDPDLYIAFNLSGKWTELQSLGPKVNSAYADFAPGLSKDNTILYFSSERPGVVGEQQEGIRPPGDLYSIELKSLLKEIKESLPESMP